MVADLMTFDESTMNEARPTLCMGPENEKRCANSVLCQCVENARSRIGIRPIIECQANLFSLSGKLTEHIPKDFAVTVKCAMRKSAEQ